MAAKPKNKHLPSPQAPKAKEPPPLPRRLAGIADKADGTHPAWRLSLLDVDHDGSWSWKATEHEIREIVQFLSEMERLTWNEIRAQMTGSKSGSHRKHHFMPVGSLCDEAQRRLQELRLDDFDEMFRFRLGNFPRLWGIFDHKGVFYPVWWDADHQVYPHD